MNEYLEDSVIVPLKRTLFPNNPGASNASLFGHIGWYGHFSKLEFVPSEENAEEKTANWQIYLIRIIPINLESRFWNDPLSHFVMVVSHANNPDSTILRTWGNREQIQNSLNSEFSQNHHLVVELMR